jgi:hypothetical protein
MHDIYWIILYEIFKTTQPIWSLYLMYMYNTVINLIKKWYYISRIKEINLQDVIIIYNNSIIFSNRLNLNYYHIKLKQNNQYIQIIGNERYQMIYSHIYSFNYLIKDKNRYISNNQNIQIYLKPIIKYTQEDCCICLSEPGSLIGICGHQNICINCQTQINKCPMCNNTHMLIRKDYIQISTAGLVFIATFSITLKYWFK